MPKIKSTWDWRGKKVPVTMLQGEPYMEVATKIALAQEEGGFSEVSHEFLKVGEKDVVRICLEFKGKHYYGSAQIKWGGQGADKTDPIENAETSAKGRALSAAGFQINSVASAEDVARARTTIEAEEPRQIRGAVPTQARVVHKALPEPETTPSREQLVAGINRLVRDYDLATPEDDLYAVEESRLWEIGKALRAQANALPAGEIALDAFKQEAQDAGVHGRELVLAVPRLIGKPLADVTYGDLATLRMILKDDPKRFVQEGA